MNWQSLSFDWNQARAFLVTAEEGSLSAAARALGLTQPTLGRQVAALEEELGVTLFERVGRSLELTASGLELLEHVRPMGEAALKMSLAASGQSQAVEGSVTITATHVMTSFHLAPIIRDLRTVAPSISIELIPSDEVRDLTRREADIAVRHARPEQPDLTAKLIREMKGYLYANSSYLDSIGRPKTAAEFGDADFIGYASPEPYISILNGMGIPVTRQNFKVSAHAGQASWEMAKLGMGIAAATSEMAAAAPEMERILPDAIPYDVPVWLVTHRELHTSRRIRMVFDFLADALAERISV